MKAIASYENFLYETSCEDSRLENESNFHCDESPFSLS